VFRASETGLARIKGGSSIDIVGVVPQRALTSRQHRILHHMQFLVAGQTDTVAERTGGAGETRFAGVVVKRIVVANQAVAQLRRGVEGTSRMASVAYRGGV
jgi:hypothetical protein